MKQRSGDVGWRGSTCRPCPSRCRQRRSWARSVGRGGHPAKGSLVLSMAPSSGRKRLSHPSMTEASVNTLVGITHEIRGRTRHDRWTETYQAPSSRSWRASSAARPTSRQHRRGPAGPCPATDSATPERRRGAAWVRTTGSSTTISQRAPTPSPTVSTCNDRLAAQDRALDHPVERPARQQFVRLLRGLARMNTPGAAGRASSLRDPRRARRRRRA
jgi:hypothetical protein